MNRKELMKSNWFVRIFSGSKLDKCCPKLATALLLFAAAGHLSAADFLDSVHLPQLRKSNLGAYIVPNEVHTEDATDIWKQSPRGVYVAVGTERGFTGAAVAPKVTHLVLVDIDPDVVRYNKINRALLRASLSLKDYLWLRNIANANQWKIRSESSYSTQEDKTLLNDERNKNFWNQYVHLMWNIFSSEIKFSFVGTNYLKNEKYFLKLRQMAIAGKIQVFQMDLNDGLSVQALVSGIRESQISLSVLDISNIWLTSFMSEPALQSLVLQFKKIADQSSLLLVTRNTPIHDARRAWNYFAFKLNELNDFPWDIKHKADEQITHFKKNAVNSIAPSLMEKCRKKISLLLR